MTRPTTIPTDARATHPELAQAHAISQDQRAPTGADENPDCDCDDCDCPICPPGCC
jgi:hypothetical protein